MTGPPPGGGSIGKPLKLTVRTDGGARGNPGPSAAGIVIQTPQGRTVAAFGRLLGRGTNNEAEYRALIIGLEEALARGADEVEALTDSQLMQRQLAGRYKVKEPRLKPLFERAKELLGEFRSARVRYVPRDENREADRMADRALDEAADLDEAVGGGAVGEEAAGPRRDDGKANDA